MLFPINSREYEATAWEWESERCGDVSGMWRCLFDPLFCRQDLACQSHADCSGGRFKGKGMQRSRHVWRNVLSLKQWQRMRSGKAIQWRSRSDAVNCTDQASQREEAGSSSEPRIHENLRDMILHGMCSRKQMRWTFIIRDKPRNEGGQVCAQIADRNPFRNCRRCWEDWHQSGSVVLVVSVWHWDCGISSRIRVTISGTGKFWQSFPPSEIFVCKCEIWGCLSESSCPGENGQNKSTDNPQKNSPNEFIQFFLLGGPNQFWKLLFAQSSMLCCSKQLGCLFVLRLGFWQLWSLLCLWR